MKKLLGLLAATGLVATTGATVVACGPADTVKELGKVELTAAVPAGTVEVEVSAFVADKALEITSDKGDKSILTFAATPVVEATKKSTVAISVAELPKEATNEVLTVKYNDEVLGEIKVSIAKSEDTTPAEKVDLSSVLKTLELGPIETSEAVPTNEEILNAAVKANAGLVKAELEIEGTATATAAKISVKADSTVYNAGSVDVTFSVVAPAGL